MKFSMKFGGRDRVRTGDPLLAKQVLSQLSYSPVLVGTREEHGDGANVVGLGRVELPTSPLSGVRSNHLSYRPEAHRTYARKLNAPSTSPEESRYPEGSRP